MVGFLHSNSSKPQIPAHCSVPKQMGVSTLMSVLKICTTATHMLRAQTPKEASLAHVMRAMKEMALYAGKLQLWIHRIAQLATTEIAKPLMVVISYASAT
jgi:hypothetical protein